MEKKAQPYFNSVIQAYRMLSTRARNTKNGSFLFARGRLYSMIGMTIPPLNLTSIDIIHEKNPPVAKYSDAFDINMTSSSGSLPVRKRTEKPRFSR
jgi:hypothetical protein